MEYKHKIKSVISSSWFMAGLLLLIYFLIQGYRYGWEDQALEVPLLKSLINPDLYLRDYYVQSLKLNFTTFFYPFLAAFIQVKQIPSVYFILFVFARYFLFFWVFKIWLFISSNKFKAFFCTLSFMLILRVEDFLYMSFSHQEFVLPFVFAGFYFFYKNQFKTAAGLFGFAANIHALYSLYPAAYLFIFLFFSMKKRGVKTFVSSLGIYVLLGLPFFVLTFQKLFIAPAALPENWLALLKIGSPESFLFGIRPLQQTFATLPRIIGSLGRYFFIVTLYLFVCVLNKDFRENYKNHAVILGGIGLLVVGFLLGDVFHNKFILTLNLSRNKHFLDLFLGGFFVLTSFEVCEKRGKGWGILLGLLLVLLSAKNMIVALLLAVSLIFIWLLSSLYERKNFFPKGLFLSVLWVILSFLLFKLCVLTHYNPFLTQRLSIFYFMAGPLWISQYLPYKFFKIPNNALCALVLIIPFFLSGFTFAKNHYQRVTLKPAGFFIIQQQWEDMQFFVEQNTPKEALLLVPYDMFTGGFRIHSNRSVLVSERDKGIVSFDFNALNEWQQRKDDVKNFKLIARGPLEDAIQRAINKYHVDYIVFTRNKAPQSNKMLTLIYYNKAFSLFRVN